MNSLIRSAKLDKTMRVLERVRSKPDARTWPDEHGVSLTTSVNMDQSRTEWQARDVSDGEPTVSQRLSNPEVTAPDMSGAAIVAPPPPTMDELRGLFSDELRLLREEASEQGHEEGVLAGRAEAQQQYANSIAGLERVVAMLGDSLDEGIEGLTEIGADVVFEAVVKIIGRSYIDRTGVLDVVKEVIRQAKDRSRLLIRVNPADYRDLMAERESLSEGLNVQHIEFAADDRVELSGCLLETPSGNLDGRLEVQLQQLRDTLMSARNRRTESVLVP